MMASKWWVVCIGWVLAWSGMFVVAAPIENDSAAQLYDQHCAVCHGEQGDGQSRARYGLNPPPRDFTTGQSWDELTSERIRNSIRHGRPGTAMVAWDKKLTLAQVDGLADYIRQRFMRQPVETVATAGIRLYKKHCSACHGDRGNGAQWTKHSLNPAPRDFTTAAARNELSLDRMIHSVTHGRPNTAMMSFGQRLSPKDINTVVAYIRHQFMQPSGPVTQSSIAAHAGAIPRQTMSELPAADMSLAFPHGLVGDVQKGRRFYQANCATCHGQQGQGDGPRSHFIDPRPRNFTAVDARRVLNRPALFRAIARGKQGTVMPAWSTVLDNQQIVDVAEFVFQAFIQGQAMAVVAPAASTSVKKKAQN